MAVFTGKKNNHLDLHALKGIYAADIKRIYDMLAMTSIGEIKTTFSFVSEIRGLRKDPETQVYGWDGENDFDGWVYADGSVFNGDDFPAAMSEYGESGSGVFKVPDLNGCFSRGESGAMRDVEQYNGFVAPHRHPLTSKASGTEETLVLKNGFVFCASGSYDDPDYNVTYYTHPATINSAGKKYTGRYVGVYPVSNTADENYPTQEDIDKYGLDEYGNMKPLTAWWSLPYTVPAFHSGAHTLTYSGGYPNNMKLLPLNMQLTFKDASVLFSDGETEGPTVKCDDDTTVDGGRFIPKSVSLPVMIYIGARYLGVDPRAA